MFTLKIDRTGSAEGSASWISDIVTVHLIDTSTRAESKTQWASYVNGDDFSDHTTFLPSDRDVALLCVVWEDGHTRYLVVGRSWLLNSQGETVERITP
jgi:hypothetical protein